MTGTVRITARLADPDEVILSYEDDGRGIPEGLHHKIFEPFFTTRRAGISAAADLVSTSSTI